MTLGLLTLSHYISNLYNNVNIISLSLIENLSLASALTMRHYLTISIWSRKYNYSESALSLFLFKKISLDWQILILHTYPSCIPTCMSDSITQTVFKVLRWTKYCLIVKVSTASLASQVRTLHTYHTAQYYYYLTVPPDLSVLCS